MLSEGFGYLDLLQQPTLDDGGVTKDLKRAFPGVQVTMNLRQKCLVSIIYAAKECDGRTSSKPLLDEHKCLLRSTLFVPDWLLRIVKFFSHTLNIDNSRIPTTMSLLWRRVERVSRISPEVQFSAGPRQSLEKGPHPGARRYGILRRSHVRFS